MTRDDVRQLLAAPFEPAAISWRVGATNSEKTRGLALAYLDARDVMNRLDEVLGVFGWQSEHVIVGERTMCRLSIRDPETGEWVSRTDGAGDTDVEAEKGAFSSSLKRSAVNFGIGRYLYDIPSPWVELEQKGKSHIIPERELSRLRSFLIGKAQSNVEAPTRPAEAPARPPATPRRLSETRDAILNAIDHADSPSRIDGILRAHSEQLKEIQAASKFTYDRIMRLAGERRGKLIERQAEVVKTNVLDELRTGSAPMLLGEP